MRRAATLICTFELRQPGKLRWTGFIAPMAGLLAPPLAAVFAVLFLTMFISVSVGHAGAAVNKDAVAVIIGNRTYAHRDVPEVTFAHNDAAAMRRYVIEHPRLRRP